MSEASKISVRCVDLSSPERPCYTVSLRPDNTIKALKAHLAVVTSKPNFFDVSKDAEAKDLLHDYTSLKRNRIGNEDELFFQPAKPPNATEKKKRAKRSPRQTPTETKANVASSEEEKEGFVVEEEEEAFAVDLSYDWGDVSDLDGLESAWGEVNDSGTQPKGDGKEVMQLDSNGDSIPVTAPPSLMRQKSYVVMGDLEISQRQKDILDEVTSKYNVDESRGVMMLRAYNWDPMQLEAAWEKDKEAVMKQAQITDESPEESKQASQGTEEMYDCELCYDNIPFNETYALNCGHRYCLGCWGEWAKSGFDKGADCVFTECMYGTAKDKCKELVPPQQLLKFLTDRSMKEKFDRWLREAFIKQTSSIKWCPRPGCDKAVEYKKKGMKRVTCACGYSFCFGCGQEDHEPAPCEAAKEWMVKNGAESSIFKWLKENAKNSEVKTCTKCHIVIEKNQGCKHMTCRNCRHEFCWLCFQDWNGHDNTYCTQYESTKAGQREAKEAEGDEEGSDFRRYQFFHSRWENYKEAVEFGQQTREKAEARMEALQSMTGTGMQTVKFLVDAIDVVIDCRKLLEWSYVWCYFLKEKDAMMALFRNHLSNLDDITEGLGNLVEQPLDKLMLESSRTAVINKSRVLTKYRRNIVDFAREHDAHMPEKV